MQALENILEEVDNILMTAGANNDLSQAISLSNQLLDEVKTYKLDETRQSSSDDDREIANALFPLYWLMKHC